MLAHNAVLIGIELFATSVWIGSLICLAVVSSAARSSLDPAARVAFFRALGRRYGIVGNVALAAAIGVGLAMLWPPSAWGRLDDTVVALAGLVVVVTALGIRQARSMTRLRRRHLQDPGDDELAQRVRRGARTAVLLRGVIGVVSLATLSVAAVLLGG
ncbi:MAG TPA: hypothetical protein VHB02_18885 [Acidimicrobiales bacterium]|nr:hypothetical protein [Acidimicrobiales bacterium]